MKVKMKLGMKAKRNRVYPEVGKGDEVRILRKREPNEKEMISTWSSNRYIVEKIETRFELFRV